LVFSVILKYNIIVINFQFFVGKELTPIIESVAKVLRISASIGSEEAGVMSIGTGGGVDQISMKVSYINRFEREPDIWLIARTFREKLTVIPHLKSIEVTPAGGSPMKSIRGSVDVMLSANSVDKLEAMREDIYNVLYKTKGLISIANTWEYDKEVLKH